MLVAGIDPGINGGVAIVQTDTSSLVAAIDIPTVGEKAKERVDVAAISKFLSRFNLQHAVIERAQAMPRQGASSGFKYGRAVGALEATLTLSGIPMTIVEPAGWKKWFQLKGGPDGKEPARQRALQLFPSAHDLLARKKDHGRAEAALMALYHGKLTP